MNGGSHHFGKLQFAVGFQREFEAGNGAWHRNGFITEDRKLLVECAVGFDIHVA
jgi:hypothetical protein